MASPGGLNWNYKLARETWKPSCSGLFYAERSDAFDFRNSHYFQLLCSSDLFSLSNETALSRRSIRTDDF